MASRNPKAEVELMKEISEFYADPLGYVMFVFPWDTDKSIQVVELVEPWKSRYPNCKFGPDKWACEFLDQWGEEIRKRGFNGRDAVDPIRFATASGHGIGKSVMAAWIIKFIMDTRPFCKGVVTANTAEQLKGKTWSELAKWHSKSLTRDLFEYSSGRGALALRHRDHPNTWKTEGQTCKEENSEAFAGQHAVDSTSFYLFDEASGVPDKIYEVREGGLTDGEPMTFDFGNPTRKSGQFFEECVGNLKKRYIVRSIDSRTVKITNKALHKQWIDDKGIDSDFCRVRILGLFPNASSVQFIPTDIVEEAMAREATPDRRMPLIIGVDVARFGDDETVIYPRIGMDAQSFPPERYSQLDGVQVANKVVAMVQRFKKLGRDTDAIFVDAGGVGVSAIDHLRFLGYNPVGVSFGGKPTDGKTYRFKVDEMWADMREALKSGLAIPAGLDELRTQLTQREFGYTVLGNKVNLESKDDMKERLGSQVYSSPDIADALALTFAGAVAPKATPDERSGQQNFAKSDYDPLDEKV